MKIPWKSQGKLREFSFSKMWPPYTIILCGHNFCVLCVSYGTDIHRLAPNGFMEYLSFLFITYMSSDKKVISVYCKPSLQRIVVKLSKSQTATCPPSFASMSGEVVSREEQPINFVLSVIPK